MLTCVVTTSQKADPGSLRDAKRWAARLGTRAVSRARRSIAALCADEGVDGALVLSPDRPPTFMSADGLLRYYYHPGMALTRIRNLCLDLGDPMVAAMGLGAGDALLDCTLGRASDALVASFVVGPTGRVVGIESSPLLAELTIHGLRTYEPSSAALTPIFRRIEAHRGDHLPFLQASPDRAFDVVCFDPLFEEPVEASSSMEPFRPLADPQPLTTDAIAEARRVASRCVVIKERPDASLWDRLQVNRLVGGKASSIAYGVIDV
jgi:16S rRNA (guanine1516-N2)-methyltransferase